LTDVAKAYEAMTRNKVDAKYGPSGILKNEISAGATANVFASANMEHPQALHDEKKSGPVFRFARNQLCALVKPGLAVDSATLLDRMLEPNIKLATSTPNPIPQANTLLRCFTKQRRSNRERNPRWNRKLCSSLAAPIVRVRLTVAQSMDGMSRKAAPISS
jgi:molybdate transport system substrate-binding protein